jgi:hypothetical protein
MKTMPTRMLLAALALCLAASLVGARAWGADPVGDLELLRGRAKLMRGTQTLLLEQVGRKTPVFAQDTVQTAGESRATLVLRATGDSVQIYGSTFFEVQEVTPQAASFGLRVGKSFFNVLKAAGLSKNFGVITPTATIGIKGTEFVVGTDGATTYLLTISGIVGIVNNVFLEREVIAGLNQATAARPNEVPTPPVPVSPDARDRIVAEEGLTTFKTLPFQSETQKKQQQSSNAAGEALESVKSTTEDSIQPAEAAPAPTTGGILFKVQ